jgi:uncharacterized protein YraI
MTETSTSRPLRRWLRGPIVALTAAAALVTVGATAASAASTGTTTTVAGPLNVRTGPTTRSTIVGQVANGAPVTLDCKVTGEQVHGRIRTTNQWDRTSSGRYVSHGYVRGATSLPACPAEAGPNGGMTPAQFVAASVGPAQQGQREFRVPASVTIAQAILESGWGRSGLTANDRNFFGIKCFNGSPGAIATGCHSYATHECVGTVCKPTTASFRSYASAVDSFRDHGHFLTVNRRYAPAFAVTGNADQFLFQMWKAGYATSPTYVQNVTAVMKKYNLYQYDLRP